MKRVVIGVLVLTLAGLATLVPARAGLEPSQIDVAFEVVNRNDSITDCQTDGATYTVRGSLALPATGPGASVTVYLHGSGDASSWNFRAVPGYDFLARMAELGHTSLYLHGLGYGPSDDADGSQMCFGSNATIAHQVIQQLRQGTYEGGGAPAFERVVLAGHSAGGIVAEVYALSFGDIDALVVAGWALGPPVEPTLYTGLTFGLGITCAQGGRAKRDGGAGGWGSRPPDDFIEAASYNVPPAIVDMLKDTWEGDPCGWGADASIALAALAALRGRISVPVLLLYGDRDLWRATQYEVERAAFMGSSDVSLAVLPDSGHMLMMGETIEAAAHVTAGWLGARGF